MEKKNPNELPKLFGVENMVTPKTLVNETQREVNRKTPYECMGDIQELLGEIHMRIASKDIVGCCDAIDAIQLRINMMREEAAKIRKHQGK